MSKFTYPQTTVYGLVEKKEFVKNLRKHLVGLCLKKVIDVF